MLGSFDGGCGDGRGGDGGSDGEKSDIVAGDDESLHSRPLTSFTELVMDRRTDRPSYGDARTHLKMKKHHLAPSLKGLQRLLNACSDFCKEWDVCLNAKKSELLYFGKTCNKLARPKLNNLPLEGVETWMYLGAKLVSNKKFSCTVVDRIKKNYKCANAIFRIEGRSDDLTMLKLIEAHCVPILTYAIEVTVFSDRNEQSKISATYNSLF